MFIGWTTTASREDAERLAVEAVERRLAACCQVDGPLLSVFRWEGVVEREPEYRVTFKFVLEKASELEAWLRESHPYENPQWLAVSVERISENYLIWARKESS